MLSLMMFFTQGFNLLFLLPALGFLAFGIGRYVYRNRQNDAADARSLQAFQVRRVEAERALELAVDAEASAIRKEYPATYEMLVGARTRSTRMWRRSTSDDDYLGLGVGRTPSTTELAELYEAIAKSSAPQPDAAERYRVLERSLWRASSDIELVGEFDSDAEEELRSMHDAIRCRDLMPVVHNFSASNLAFLGASSMVLRAVQTAVLRLAFDHSPTSLSICACLGPDASTRLAWDWLKWLPHAWVPSPILAHGRIVSGRDASNQLLGSIADRLDELTANRVPIPDGRLLILLDQRAEADVSLVSRMLDSAPTTVRVAFIGTTAARIPGVLKPVNLEVLDDGTAVKSDHAGTLTLDAARLTSHLEVAARSMAPLYDAQRNSLSGGIPSRVALSFVSGVPAGGWEALVRDNWAVAKAQIELRSVIGADESGEVTFDFVTEGPHMLVGGTTGSGKSELLQTLVVSLALCYSPAELCFLLIDFKGGAAFDAFKDLPHAVGLVSNLEAGDVRRTLDFLDMEVRRRMSAMKSTKDYPGHRTRAERDGQTAIPRMVVIIDEFAGLLQQYPEYEQSVLDIAARGRSLGIHLVLATQRPAGIVKGQVRANVDARVCLRTLDEQDSAEVIDQNVAAFIPPKLAGRAFIRRESGKLREFQSAFGGATDWHERISGEGERVSLRSFDPLEVGSGSPVHGLNQPAAPNARTDLEYAVAACATVWMDAAGSDSDQPTLPPSLDSADPALLVARSSRADRPVLDLARWDNQREQQQPVVEADLGRGGLLVRGGPGSGKTHTLAMLGKQALQRFEGSKLLTLDLQDGRLHETTEELRRFPGRVLYALPTLSLPDVCLVIEQLEMELLDRRQRQGGPRILVLVDGLDMLSEALEGARSRQTDWMLRLASLIANGRRSGIHFAASAGLRQPIGRAVVGAFAEVIELSSSSPSTLAGRFEHRGGGAAQVLLADARTPTPAHWGGRPFGPIDRSAAAKELHRSQATREGEWWSVALGVEELEHSLFRIVLDSSLLVVGPPRSGRSSALRRIVAQLSAASDTEIPVVRARPSAGDQVWDGARLVDPRVFPAGVDLPALFDDLWPPGTESPRVLVVDDVGFLPDDESFWRGFTSQRLCLVAAGIPTDKNTGQVGWKRTIGESRRGLYLQPSARDFDVGAGVFGLGRGIDHYPLRSYNVSEGVYVTDTEQVVVQC